MLEADVESHLRARIKALGGLCEKHLAVNQRGVPDQLVTWPWGEMTLVELKKPGEKLDDHQKRDHARRAKRGIRVVVLSSKVEVDAWVSAQLVRGWAWRPVEK